MSAHRPETIMGWDVGGAHLKVSWLDAKGRLQRVQQEPCTLWRGLPHLHAALDAVLQRGHLRLPLAHGVTMTGEMTDLFGDRNEGVRALVDAMAQHLGKRRVGFYAGDAGWLAPAAAKAHPAAAASCNWHASAQALAMRLPAALLVDMGSTTTDIVPIAAGRVQARGFCDSDRLALGELVYSGVVRTPLMALATSVPVAGRRIPLMAELFATTADVYRMLGWLPVEADQHDSADGAAKTVAASRQRLARMVGCDAYDQPDAIWDALAAWFADLQLDLLERAALQVLERVDLPGDAPLVAAGVGSFVVERLAHRLGRQLWPYATALGLAAPEHEPLQAHWASWCAPAVAVALLYREHMA